MRKTVFAIMVILLAFSFVSCSEYSGTGNLTVTVEALTKAVVEPDLNDVERSSYKLCMTHQETLETKTESFTGRTFTLNKITAGLWSAYIEAYDSNGIIVAVSETKTVAVKRNQTTSEDFIVRLMQEGTGTIAFRALIPTVDQGVTGVMVWIDGCKTGTLHSICNQVEGNYYVNEFDVTQSCGTHSIQIQLVGQDYAELGKVHSAEAKVYANVATEVEFTMEDINTPKPTVSVQAGYYEETKTVALSSTIANTVIYYTTDGTTPTSESTPYTGPITVDHSMTIKAIATRQGYATSDVMSATYSIKPATPTLSGVESYMCDFIDPFDTEIECATPGCEIKYIMTYGLVTGWTSSYVAENGTLYTAPIHIDQYSYIFAVAISPDGALSDLKEVNFWRYCNAPTPSVPEGRYSDTQNVVFSSDGCTSYSYYVEGSSGWKQVTSSSLQLSVDRNMKIQMRCYNSTSMLNSQTVSITYEIKVADPTFSVSAGSYDSAQTVSLASTTSNVTIYYTLDGTTPTSESSVYSEPINVDHSMTIKAIAVREGCTSSEVVEATYSIKPVAPTFSRTAPDYDLVISTTTPECMIKYLMVVEEDIPDNADVAADGIEYTGPIEISSSWTDVKAVAISSDGIVSDATRELYAPETWQPTPSVESGTYSNTQNLILTDTINATYTVDDGPRIYYSDEGVILIDRNMVVTAYNQGSWALESDPLVLTYVIKVADPTFSVSAGTYGSAQTVELSSATSNAVIRYTTDGSDPTESSDVYSAPIAVSSNMTIKAIATREGCTSSEIVTAEYKIRTVTPTFSPEPAAAMEVAYPQNEEFDVTITAVEGATIYYTTDGTTPTTSSDVYSAPIHIGDGETVQVSAIAVKEGYAPSEVMTGFYAVMVQLL